MYECMHLIRHVECLTWDWIDVDRDPLVMRELNHGAPSQTT